MARTHAYDPDPLNRFRLDDDALDTVKKSMVEDALNPLLDWVGDRSRELMAERDIPFEVAFLYLTRLVQEAAESAVHWRAAEALASGVPKSGIAEIMGWRGGGSYVTKKWPHLDQIISVRNEVDQTGKNQTIDFGQGFNITIQPGDNTE